MLKWICVIRTPVFMLNVKLFMVQLRGCELCATFPKEAINKMFVLAWHGMASHDKIPFCVHFSVDRATKKVRKPYRVIEVVLIINSKGCCWLKCCLFCFRHKAENLWIRNFGFCTMTPFDIKAVLISDSVRRPFHYIRLFSLAE